MSLTSEQNIKKIQDLLLNRIDGLRWNYFELNLEEKLGRDADVYADKESVERFFDNIVTDLFGRSKVKNEELIPTYTAKEILKIVITIIRANPNIMKGVIKRLFDVNEIRNESDADLGTLGKFNDKDRRFRNKIYKRKIREGHRKDEDNITILAEGDSWFQFPRVYLNIDPVTDIIDWLIKEDKYAICSLAAGGDWFSNIFHSGEYIEELPKVSPDVFLLSGGGNDLVGSYRLAIMVRNPTQEGKRNLSDEKMEKLINRRVESFENRNAEDYNFDLDRYKKGLEFLSDEFFDFINLYFIQYFIFFYGLSQSDKYKNLLMITHGYDYPLPYNGSRAFMLSVQKIINEFTDTGHWLFEPLNMKGITEAADQEAILYTMITEFNEMLYQLASFSRLPNLYHIDCRGVARDDHDWFDELHLKSESYGVIAKAIKDCINDNLRNSDPNRNKIYLAHKYRTE